MFQTFPHVSVCTLLKCLSLFLMCRHVSLRAAFKRKASFTKVSEISRDVLKVRSSVLLKNHTACPGVPFAVVTGGQQFLNQYCVLLLDWVGLWMWV